MAKRKAKTNTTVLGVVVVVMLVIAIISLYSSVSDTSVSDQNPEPTLDRLVVGVFVAIEDNAFVIERNGKTIRMPIGESTFTLVERIGPKLNSIELDDITPGSEITIVTDTNEADKQIVGVMVVIK